MFEQKFTPSWTLSSKLHHWGHVNPHALPAMLANMSTEVTLMGIEKDGAYIAGEAPTVSSGKLAVAASD